MANDNSITTALKFPIDRFSKNESKAEIAINTANEIARYFNA